MIFVKCVTNQEYLVEGSAHVGITQIINIALGRQVKLDDQILFSRLLAEFGKLKYKYAIFRTCVLTKNGRYFNPFAMDVLLVTGEGRVILNLYCYDDIHRSQVNIRVGPSRSLKIPSVHDDVFFDVLDADTNFSEGFSWDYEKLSVSS